MASNRLKRDYARIMKDKIPFIVTHPREDNILEWHYVLQGAPGTDFEGGLYHGKLVFPANFPFAPPSIFMITPNGRFKTNERLCLTISDYHPEAWKPVWTVSTILVGLQSYMNDSSASGIGIITDKTSTERKRLAKASLQCNLENSVFCRMFKKHVEMIKKGHDFKAELPLEIQEL